MTSQGGAPDDISAFRRYIEGALAFSGGTHTFDDIRDGVAAGTLQFWPGAESVVITQILTHPRKQELHFFLAGGNLASLEKMYPHILAWGKSIGCHSATMIGRKGWERTVLVSKGGWQQKQVCLEMDL